MLRITASTSAKAAQAYYTTGLSRQDYYSAEQDVTGTWHGQGAMRLGLMGDVTREAFAALTENRHPGTGDTLTVRQKEGRRVGYDFTFSAPKSVSLLYGLTGDKRLREVFETAVTGTMQEMETAMQARVRKEGESTDRTTGNLIWAGFTHELARPVDGTPDPLLHHHAFVFNATWDRVEQQWKAGQFHDLKRDAPYYEAAFHARLASGMRELGFDITRHGKWWDLEGLPRPLLDKFSRRTAEVEAAAQAMGITDPDAKGALGAKTRVRKEQNLDMATLRMLWQARMTRQERLAVERVLAQTDGTTDHTDRTRTGPTVQEAIAYAAQAVFERQSVVSETQFREAALRYGTGSVRPEHLRDALRHVDSPLLTATVDGRTLVTTREVLAEEQAMLNFARQGRGSCTPFGLGHPLYRSTQLNAGQAAAVRHLLGSWDRVILLRGGAGTGKTTLMREAVAAIARTSGQQVFTFAPSADASRGVLRQEGFAGAETVEHLLRNSKLQQRLHGQVIWIDEAGLLGVRDMARVCALAKQVDCRLILSGDSRQHGSVSRGDALRLLETQAGLRPAEVTEIVRQRGAYKEAVALLAQGQTVEGLADLERLGWVVEASDDVRPVLMAEEYLRTLQAGKTALVVAPTHLEGEQVTAAIRQALRQEGQLGTDEQPLFTLRSLHWTEADKADTARYRPGLVVQFVQNAPGVTKGARFQVTRINGDQVWGRDAQGRDVALPRHLPTRFEVYEPHTLRLAPGDPVRITQNGYSEEGHRLNNGARFTVAGLTSAGDILLTNGWHVPQDYAHLALGYYTTSHAAQGKTVDRVLLAQSTTSFPASSQEQFYVSVSRGREGVRIFTDDTEALRHHILRSSQRGSATELVRRDLDATTRPRALTERLRHMRARVRRLVAHGRRRQIITETLREQDARSAAQAEHRWQERVQHARPGMER